MTAPRTGTPREFPDARLTIRDRIDVPAEVLEPLHAYALGHATGEPRHFRRAFRPAAHVEGLRQGDFASWDLETYCALFDGRPAADEGLRSRVLDDVDGWRIANEVYHRHEG